MRSPPLLVHNHFNKSNAIAIFKNNIEQPNIINQYNMSMWGVDRMDQNISAYMINLRTNKCW